MSLIKSISGIRGTIGDNEGEGLSPIDIVKFTASYSQWVKEQNKPGTRLRIVVGRDGRISGAMVEHLVLGTLMSMGMDVINLDFASTPTTELAVINHKADGGLILTASHNPKQWNALKLLNRNGEFLSAVEGNRVLEIAEKALYTFAQVDALGTITEDKNMNAKHIQQVVDLPAVDVDAIRKANFKVVFDSINSVGGIILPDLFKALGVTNVVGLNTEPTGNFFHTPEPLPENLGQISEAMREHKADVGFVVDPDVDRLAIVCEDGSMFGEEYTLVSVSDYILSQKKGNTVSNLSSTRALRDVTEQHGGQYSASAVGEVNVVAKMKEVNAVIGGEGNGGVIYPELHYGRDALVGIALFLSHLAKSKVKTSELRAKYPAYFISKNKIQLTPAVNVDAVLAEMKKKYANERVNDIDGVKIDFPTEWVHLRKSNTEPIIRIYAESKSESSADALAQRIMAEIKQIAGI